MFTLHKKEDDKYQEIMSIVKSEGDTTPKYGEVTGVDQTSSFTSANNAVTIGNLPDGIYKQVEDSAPSEYVIIKKEIDFEIRNGKLIGQDIKDVLTFDNNTAMITVAIIPGASLPNTAARAPCCTASSAVC